MSFYPDINVPADGGKAFTIVINSHGEVVVYKLGPDGKPIGFGTTKTGHELIRLLADEFVKGKGSADVIFSMDEKWTCNRITGEWTWEKAARVLNGKSGARKARMEGQVRFISIARYIRWDNDTREHIVTDLGKKLDAMHKSDKAVV